jgi:hypothetical protein
MRNLETDVFQRLVHHQVPSLQSRYFFFVPANLGDNQRLYHQIGDRLALQKVSAQGLNTLGLAITQYCQD